MSNELAQAGTVRRLYATELNDEEAGTLHHFRELFCRVLEKKASFIEVTTTVARELSSSLSRFRLDLRSLRNFDAANFVDQVGKGTLALFDNGLEPSEAEINFSRDVIGLIDFAMRNSIGFAMVANVLSHDLGEIFYHHGLEKALSTSFLPKCSGYRSYGPDSVGESELEI